MPSASNNLSSYPTKNVREFEVLVVPPSPTSPTLQQPSQPLRTKTERINCSPKNGTIFWIPEGYRPVLVRIEDLPLLVGTENNSPSPSNSGDSSGDESGY